ncbi:MAG: hypothetical protein Kapaf2KO_07520 [Candidatus Kapaibacteriales bacterium]
MYIVYFIINNNEKHLKKNIYIIDGFNLYHSLYGDSKPTVENTQIFVDSLASYQEETNTQISLVFDGDNKGIGSRNLSLDIIFSGRYVNADIVIKRLVDRFDHKPSLVIVSSDREVMSYAGLSGCQFLKSDDFAFKIKLDQRQNQQMQEDLLDEYGAKYKSRVINDKRDSKEATSSKSFENKDTEKKLRVKSKSETDNSTKKEPTKPLLQQFEGFELDSDFLHELTDAQRNRYLKIKESQESKQNILDKIDRIESNEMNIGNNESTRFSEVNSSNEEDYQKTKQKLKIMSEADKKNLKKKKLKTITLEDLKKELKK